MTRDLRCRVEEPFYDKNSGAKIQPSVDGDRIETFSADYAQRLERHGLVTILDDDLGRPEDDASTQQPDEQPEATPDEDQSAEPPEETPEAAPTEDQSMAPPETKEEGLEEATPPAEDTQPQAEASTPEEGTSLDDIEFAHPRGREVAESFGLSPDELAEVEPESDRGLTTDQVRNLADV